MPGEYYYINESTLWQPIMVSYSILIAGATVLLLGIFSYLTGRFKKIIPLSILTGASMFLVILLGPLGDMLSPYRAFEIFINPHIFPSDTNPGFSLIAFYGGILWPINVILLLAFGLLYFSYPIHKMIERKSKLRGLRKILSLGVASEEKYERVNRVNKVVAALLGITLIPWLFYPALLFVTQTSNFIWSEWYLLPIQNLAENLVLAVSLLAFLYTLHFKNKMDEELSRDLSQLLGILSVFLLVIVGLQLTLWHIRYSGSDYYSAITTVYSLLLFSIVLLVLTVLLSVLAEGKNWLILASSLLGIIAVIIVKWDVIIVGQTVSKTGISTLSLELHSNWFLNMLAPIALAVLIYVILTSIFPMEVNEE